MQVLPHIETSQLICFANQSKSIDWFLYEGNIGISWVKYVVTNPNISNIL